MVHGHIYVPDMPYAKEAPSVTYESPKHCVYINYFLQQLSLAQLEVILPYDCHSFICMSTLYSAYSAQ